jgi:succinyl-diaminopimelate desuccinylase
MTMMRPIQRRITMTTSLRDNLVTMTCDSVRIPSTLDRPDLLQAVIDYADAKLRDLPCGKVFYETSNNKPSIVYSLRGNTHAKLILNAHLDIVPARGEQFEPEIRDGRIYGRGTQDVKGAGRCCCN